MIAALRCAQTPQTFHAMAMGLLVADAWLGSRSGKTHTADISQVLKRRRYILEPIAAAPAPAPSPSPAPGGTGK